MNRCADCGLDDGTVRWAHFRRVVALVFFDQIHTLDGPFCRSCRYRLFVRYQVLTIVLGWWGVLAMLFRNPAAIIANFWSLRGREVEPTDFALAPYRQ
jgi:hypothetical protein